MDDLKMAMHSRTSLQEHATSIRAAYAGGPIAPIRHGDSDLTMDDAYAIQAINRDLWVGQGRRIVGTKIGLTSVAVQSQLGVDEPDYGYLFDDMMVTPEGTVEQGRMLQPKVEVEIAFILRRDVAEPLASRTEAVDAVDYAVPALEIVDSRIANWDITMVDTVADNASSGMFALGTDTVVLERIDLTGCVMRMAKNGRVVSEGSGAACLGNPLDALQWLSAARCARGDPLRAGDIILSGALGPMVPASPGDLFAASIEGVGNIEVSFAI